MVGIKEYKSEILLMIMLILILFITLVVSLDYVAMDACTEYNTDNRVYNLVNETVIKGDKALVCISQPESSMVTCYKERND